VSKRISVWVLGDQLLSEHPAITAAEEQADRDHIRVVMVESDSRTGRLPYHRKKIVLLYSAMRHYAERLRGQGYQVDYYKKDTVLDALKEHVDDHSPDKVITMAASEYHGRQFQQERMADAIGVETDVLPNTQFLIGTYNPYADADRDKNYVMENFYRQMRRHFDVLMDGDDPIGGKWNYDKQNRKPLPKNIELPAMPGFSHDEITKQVIEEVNAEGVGVGNTDNFNYAVTHEQATAALGNFIQYRLVDFGPYEDAMTVRGDTLFHSVLSPYINIGLLEPMTMIRAVEKAYYEDRAPINSVEGFVRQVLGWREYMYWHYWRQMPEIVNANYWNAGRKMPQMFWDGNTKMNCISCIVGRLQDTAYAHHIERLMVISTFCLMAGINPKEVTDWFKVFFIDAYDWVMQPNVVGMGLNADGGKIATKPYVASANYINKMSDYCKSCDYKHTKRHGEDACPFNYLYWNFLIEHEEELRANPRTGRNVLNLRHLDDEERQQVQKSAQEFLDTLEYNN
jgi:deoxyribodipyrimidine photolyase-related protein